MPLRCCIKNCSSNAFGSLSHTPIFSFPKDSQKAEEWLKAIPLLQELPKNMGVCIKHWPENAECLNINHHIWPMGPPTIFLDYKSHAVSEKKTGKF